MANKVYVIGVGMTKFEKPGRREGWDYPDMARESGTNALQDAGVAYSEVEQGYVGYCRRRFDLRAAGALRAGHDRDSDRQRQQQLLDRLYGALLGGAGHPRRAGRLHHRARLREDATRLAERWRPGPRIADGQTRQGDVRDRRVRDARRTVDVRRRRPRAHAPIRHAPQNISRRSATKTTSTR